MKLGLVTDIHEQLAPLRFALDHFAHERVDRVVVIGDLFEYGEQIEETCRLLADARAVGVWGNHDFGICSNPTLEERAKYSAVAIGLLTSLRPRLDVAGCHFTHIEPWLDPEDIADLWYFEGPPDDQDKLARIFNATPQRVMFAGHYHRWLLATPAGLVPWSGERAVQLAPPQRYFAVIGALCAGWYAIYDTESCELQPYRASAPDAPGGA